jgi:8-oxo-dGTP pyrophosphatase MutT (NUDIX family)
MVLKGKRDEPVVAAVIERQGNYLVCRRPAHKRHGGLWEFPGGKRLGGESAEDALRRELAEELNLAVTRVGRTLFTARDPQSPFVIAFIGVEAAGTPEAFEHTELMWCPGDRLHSIALAPADARFVRAHFK